MQTYTLGDALQKLGFGQFQLRLLLLTGGAWSADAGEVLLLSFLLPAVTKQWHLTPAWSSSIGSAVFVGMVIGAQCLGYLSDWKGRRVAFAVTLALVLIFGVASAFAQSAVQLLIVRFVVGVGLGGLHVPFSLFMEMMQKKDRGKWSIIIELFWSFGAILEAGLAWLVMEPLGWRWLIGFTALPFVLFVVCFACVPESPRFLEAAGRMEDVHKVLQLISKVNKKPLPDGTLIATQPTLTEEHEAGALLQDESDQDEEEVVKPPKLRQCLTLPLKTLGDLLHPALRRTTLLLWVVWVSEALTYYGVVLMTPIYFAHLRGRNSSSSWRLYLDVMITTAAEAPGVLISVVAVDKLGRRWTQVVSFVLCSVGVACLAIPMHEAALVFAAVVGRAGIAAAFAVTWVFTPEVYPTRLRSSGLGTAVALSRIGAAAAPFVVSMITPVIFVLPVIAACSLLAGICVLLIRVETGGRNLRELPQTIEELELRPVA